MSGYLIGCKHSQKMIVKLRMKILEGADEKFMRLLAEKIQRHQADCSQCRQQFYDNVRSEGSNG